MNPLPLDEPLQDPSESLLPTPPLATELEGAQPAVEGVESESIKPKLKIKTKAKPTKRIPPEVSGLFLGEEDLRMIRKMTQVISSRVGIKKNNSYKI